MKWTKQEDEILKQNYEKYSYQELVEKFFPERSVPSVRGRIKSLGLQSKTFRWTDENIKLLTEKYENGMYVKDIQKNYFPELTVSQVTSKASSLHLKHKVSCVWSLEEDEILKEKFADYTNKEIHELFIPNKTVRAIEARARKLSLNKAELVWTDEEDNLLREIYGTIKNDDLVNYFSKTYSAILRRAGELNLKQDYIPWTDEEISYLNEYYPQDISLEEIHNKYIPNRTISEITGKANSIGLLRNEKPREWTDEEIEILKKYYNTYSAEVLIERFFPDRKIGQISKKKSELGLVVTNRFKDGEVYWTEDKLDLLYNEYPYMNTEEFYNKYFKDDMSLSGLYGKINKLGIKKDEEFVTGWTSEEDEYLKENYRNMDLSVADIAKYLGKDESSVQYRAVNVFGIYRKDELFSEEERELIRELYPHYRTSDFIDKFPNRTVDQLERYARRMGVKKTKDYIRWVTLEGTKNSLETSKPQQIINEVLEEMGINYISEYECRFYLIDHYLTDYNLMIEVQGDFWHCSPLLSKKANTNGVKSNVAKDKRKHTNNKNKYGIEVLYLWETDINENLELCKELIKLYIENNGILENYHSFNYVLNNGKLEVIEEKYVVGY